jgi:hypothetical protein
LFLIAISGWALQATAQVVGSPVAVTVPAQTAPWSASSQSLTLNATVTSVPPGTPVNDGNVTFTVFAGQRIGTAASANPVVFTTAAPTGLASGNTVVITGATGGWTGVNGAFLATVVDANDFSIPVDASSFPQPLTGSVFFANLNGTPVGTPTASGMVTDGSAFLTGYPLPESQGPGPYTVQAAYGNSASGFEPNSGTGPLRILPTAKIGTCNAGQWYLDANGNGTWDGAPPDVSSTFGAGLRGAIPVIGDWNGDGHMKTGVYYQGFWYLDFKGDGAWDGGVIDKRYRFGWSDPNVIPVVGDWNGDGRTKIGIYYQGFWFLDYDGDGVWDGGVNDKAYNFGWPATGVTPILGDWNGDGRAKIGIYYYGFWFLDYDGNGVWDGGIDDKAYHFGWPATGVTPMLGDWNGDGRTKIGIYYYGSWYLDYDGDGLWDGGVNDKAYTFGWFDPAVTPVVGDWTGTGTTKIGIFFNTYWFLDFIGNGIWDGGVVDQTYVWGYTPLAGAW